VAPGFRGVISNPKTRRTQHRDNGPIDRERLRDAHDIDSQGTTAHAEKSDHATSATTAHSKMHAEAAQTDSETHGEGHMEIELLSISAGILIVIGHISNLVILRRKRKDALAAECAVA
jgi:hypothetical protein